MILPGSKMMSSSYGGLWDPNCCSSSRVRSWFGWKWTQKHNRSWNLGGQPYSFSPEPSHTLSLDRMGYHALMLQCLNQDSGFQAVWRCVWYSLGLLFPFRKEQAARRRRRWCQGAISMLLAILSQVPLTYWGLALPIASVMSRLTHLPPDVVWYQTLWSPELHPLANFN